ncbi:uncharacterized protein K02A2.6-like [Lytechinus pictus]|uniref:uncharacterized protein K02A2.6-like n=1 Tax=Lytechinus pictus TaxID=7653 RepID=UPI0030B9DE21
MSAHGLSQPAPFDASSARASNAWQAWKTAFEYYLLASQITDDSVKRALLLHCAGPNVQQLFATLDGTGTTYASALKALTDHFEPQRNVAYERHLFRQCSQNSGESTDDYCLRLRTLSASCDFGDQRDDNIRDQFIDQCSSKSLRRRLLREQNLKLSDLLLIARATEVADKQASSIEISNSTSLPVNDIRARQSQLTAGETQYSSSPRSFQPPQRDIPRGRRDNYGTSRRPSQHATICSNCGLDGHYASDTVCRARGQKCRRCQKTGHFSRMCRSSAPRNIANNQSSHAIHISSDSALNVSDNMCDETLFTVGNSNTSTRVDIAGISIDMLIDTGASVNIIDSSTYDWMRGQTTSNGIRLAPNHIRLFAYGSNTPLPVRGEFHATISCSRGTSAMATFFVVEGGTGCLLGKRTAIQLQLVKLEDANAVHMDTQPAAGDIKSAYPEVFTGFGKLEGYKAHVHVNPDVKPVAQPPRRIPFHLRSKVEEKLQELLEKDIIEPVTGPTSWASPLVVVPKPNGEVRVCVDMRRANQAVIRERHPIPTLDETLESLNGAAIFSKLDLKWGYHQVELDEESRDITTFVTHKGVMRYKRLIFGLSSASEIYQYAIQTALQGLEGVRNISDDIVVFGKDVEEHDIRLNAVLQRLRDRHLTVNADKCIFRAPRIMFFGFVISKDGISANEARVAAIKEARMPTNQSEVRSFLGLVNYCARLIPNLATIAEPLRKLTRGDQPWTWGPEQRQSFERLRNALTSDDVMAHFVTGAPTELRVDASPFGLGAVLTQTIDGITRPVAYASRTLSDVERRYSQTEREALAVVWGCERFHLFLSGAEFTLLTDHKPLEVIYGPHGKPHARIERWVLRLQQYKFKVRHMPGKTNPADVLSRLPIPNQPPRDRNIAEEYIDAIIAYAVPRALTREQITTASQADQEIQMVIESLKAGKWHENPKLSPYRRIANELSAKNGLLLRGKRIVIPSVLREQTLDLAHESHPGIVRMKQMLRTKVWWPQIDAEAESKVKMCHVCQVEMPSPPSEPLQPSQMPRSPWNKLHIDLCGPLPTGESLLVVIDAATRWPEVEIIRSTTTKVIISRLDRIFAQHGYPEEIVSDNGPQFISQEFASYLRSIGVNHRRITPYHPQANAEVERFNATIMKAIRTARHSGRDWHQAVNTFLLAYRSTPHPATKSSPAKLLYNRELRTKLPFNTATPKKAFKEASRNDKVYKEKMKKYHDGKTQNRRRDNVKCGDHVITKQRKCDKFSSRFDPNPWVVVEKKGGSVKIRRGNEITMRYMSQVRKIPNRVNINNEVEGDLEDDRIIHTEEAPCPLRRSNRQIRPPDRLTYYQSGIIM